jgi:threonine/homoserine/homoserine lactone efflux protein
MSLILSALAFGLAAGLNPGPLGIFVIHQTMTKGNRKGFIASLIPFITDIPIILSISLLSINLAKITWFTIFISFIGAVYLLVLAYKLFHSTAASYAETKKDISWINGAKMNFLNPAPYIFWGTVGNFYILETSRNEAIIFVLCVLATISATKLTVAVLIKYLGNKFNPNIYNQILKLLSVVLVFFSLKLLLSCLNQLFT